MTMAITFPRQNEVALHPCAIQHSENLILVVVLISESKALYWLIMKLKMDKAYTNYLAILKPLVVQKKPHA